MTLFTSQRYLTTLNLLSKYKLSRCNPTWKQVVLHESKYLTLKRKENTSSECFKSWEYITRKNGSQGSFIIALNTESDITKSSVYDISKNASDGIIEAIKNPASKILLIKQFRLSIDKYELAFPGGKIENEYVIDRMTKELYEEAGCMPVTEIVGGANPNETNLIPTALAPTISDEYTTPGICRVVKVSDGLVFSTSDVEVTYVVWAPVRGLLKWLRNRPEIINSCLYTFAVGLQFGEFTK